MKTRFKKLTALLLSVLMLMTALPFAGTDFSITASAESGLAASGQCGDDVYWSFDSETGVLTLSGTGSMYDYATEESPFYDNYDIIQLVIESGIASVGEYAFEGCGSLLTVRINALLVSVGACAFDMCLDLADVYFIGDIDEWDDLCANTDYGNYDLLNKSVHCLGDLTENFYGPLSYDIFGGEVEINDCDMSFSGALDIPAEIDGCPVTKIIDSCFSECKYITGINVPASVKTVGSRAFSGCEKLKSVSFAEGVTAIGNNTFEDCYDLETVSFPSTLTAVGDSVFKNCNALKSISVSSDNQYYTTDSDGVLYTKDYSELIRYPVGSTGTEYTVNADTEIIRDYAFSSAENLKKVTAKGNLKTVGEYAFRHCYHLETAVLPDTVNEIGAYAFSNTALTAIFVPKGITEIKKGTYDNCLKLKVVEIPDGVTTCDSAFSGVETDKFIIGAGVLQSNDFSSFKTAEFTVSENNPYFAADEQGVLYNKDKTVLIRFPVLSDIAQYEIPDSVTEIGENAFKSTKELNVLVVPVSVRQIDKYAFNYSNISYIGYMGIQDEWDAIEINKNAFMGSSGIRILTEYGKCSGDCGENLSWLYDNDTNTLFINGSGEMESNASFDDYGWYSFKDKIELVVIADGAVSVGANAFAGCTKLIEVCLGGDIKTIGENAFADCTGLTVVTFLSDRFTADNAFSNNSPVLTVFAEKTNTAAADFAGAQNAKLVTVEYSEREDGNVLSFGGETVIYNGISYNCLEIFTAYYQSVDYLFFDRIVFDGESAEGLTDVPDGLDADSADLAFTSLYVNLRAVGKITNEALSFDLILKLLKDGKTDAFKLEQHKSAIAQFFSDIVDGIKTVIGLLKLISEAINSAIKKIFRK